MRIIITDPCYLRTSMAEWHKFLDDTSFGEAPVTVDAWPCLPHRHLPVPSEHTVATVEAIRAALEKGWTTREEAMRAAGCSQFNASGTAHANGPYMG